MTVPLTIETPDGYRVDPETGEVLGHINARPEFHVTDLQSAEWVLERMQEADAEVKAIELRLAAIREQMETMAADKRRRQEWLKARFGSELEAFAREALEGQKRRSLVTPFGTLGFRSSPGGTTVLDKHLAIAWAKTHCPEAVVVREDVVVTPLKGRDDLPTDAFEVREPADRFYIKTGVE